jgi:cytochrome P450
MLGDTAHVVVSGLRDVRDIFIKQGASSQNRPPSRFQLLMRDGFFPGLNNGEKWRQSRRMWQAVLNNSAAKQYLPYQELETRQLLFDLLRAPTEWRDHIERYSNSVAMTMVNGRRIIDAADPRVKETIQDLYDLAETGVRGAFLDSWPFLWKLPEWMFPVCRQARKIAAKHRSTSGGIIPMLQSGQVRERCSLRSTMRYKKNSSKAGQGFQRSRVRKLAITC